MSAPFTSVLVPSTRFTQFRVFLNRFFSIQDAASSNKIAIRKGEVIKVKSVLCSTFLTQNCTQPK